MTETAETQSVDVVADTKGKTTRSRSSTASKSAAAKKSETTQAITIAADDNAVGSTPKATRKRAVTTAKAKVAAQENAPVPAPSVAEDIVQPAPKRGRRKRVAPSAQSEQAIAAETVPTKSEPAATAISETESPKPLFSELGLSAPIMRAIEEMGYEHPTPIQARAIPVVLGGQDVLGVAQTGTGKTASFTLPMLERLAGSRARARMPRSLILEPTRELALQVAENLTLYGKHLRLNHALLIGGESMADQRAVLNQGVDILIATPGRLMDLFDRGGLLLTQTSILVVDEADRMLDMGFIPDITRIVSLLPAQRQTLLFSATMAPEIRTLADQFLRLPEEITVSRPSSVATTIEEALLVVDETEKRRVLRKLLKREAVQNAIVFCNRKRDVDELYKSLHKHGFSVGHLHGDLAQSLRFKTLERFKTGEVQILVCSDVAARGIDIGGLSHVFNFDLPFNAEDYIHRIGRTGRAGKTGHAYSMATPRQKQLAEAIEKLKHAAIPVIEIEGIETLPWADPEQEGEQPDRRERRGKDRGARNQRQTENRD
ncbi:DEAD/DEAH box helicase, partial [Asaia astilbis]|uniref:DEAD/DEAH box helicase n=1 Tax=Asaia astilbis TaxID=610244 RepID=UPI0038CDBCB6